MVTAGESAAPLQTVNAMNAVDTSHKGEGFPQGWTHFPQGGAPREGQAQNHKFEQRRIQFARFYINPLVQPAEGEI